MSHRMGAAAGSLLVAAALLGWPALAGAKAATMADIQHYLWRKRLLLVFAARADDSGLARQAAIFEQAATGAAERDLLLIRVVGDAAEAARLRKQFGVAADGFRAVLVGKDGGAKLSASEPVPAERLFATIDAMPMRRREMR